MPLALISILTSIIFSIEFICFCLGVFFLFKKKLSISSKVLFVAFALVMTSPLSSYLTYQQEREYQVLQDLPQHAEAILVLGSGGVPEVGLTAVQRLDHAALQRTLEGIRLWKLNPEKLLIFSSQGRPGYPSQASLYANVAK